MRPQLHAPLMISDESILTEEREFENQTRALVIYAQDSRRKGEEGSRLSGSYLS